MTNLHVCAACGSETMKTGKLHGVATVHGLNSRVGIGGSELLITFCANCGEVLRMKVAQPEKIEE